jgi:hypothetical protein
MVYIKIFRDHFRDLMASKNIENNQNKQKYSERVEGLSGFFC